MRRWLLVAVLALAACGGEANDSEQATADTPAAALPPLADPPTAEELAALDSEDCVVVTELYLEAISSGDFALGARVWDDPVIDAARLEAVYAAYKEPQFAWNEPFVEGAAGSLYCTVSGKLTDVQDPARPALEGTLLLRRANDVPGASAEQLRWTLRSSTFVEPMERSGTGEGA